MASKTKAAWVVWGNSDKTEGRGGLRPEFICELEATARRLAHRSDVQGSNGVITQVELAPAPDGRGWYGPVHIQPASVGDRAEQEVLRKAAERRAARDVVVRKATELGLSGTEIALLEEDA